MDAPKTEEFKVILVGESGVGKTSFVVRFTESKFQNVYESTVGVDCKKVAVNVGDTSVDLHIWDTAGQERFKSIVNRFFRGAHGAIVMYDVTKKESFDEVHWWLKETREHITGIPIFLGQSVTRLTTTAKRKSWRNWRRTLPKKTGSTSTKQVPVMTSTLKRCSRN